MCCIQGEVQWRESVLEMCAARIRLLCKFIWQLKNKLTLASIDRGRRGARTKVVKVLNGTEKVMACLLESDLSKVYVRKSSRGALLFSLLTSVGLGRFSLHYTRTTLQSAAEFGSSVKSRECV